MNEFRSSAILPAVNENPLVDCGKPLFFGVADARALALVPPPGRLGETVRVAVRSLRGMQKEALVASARTGTVWRLASDEGAYLGGLDEAPCPLSFLTTGMVCSYMTETVALAELRGVPIERIRLVIDNYYTMEGSARAGTMRGGAGNVALTAQIASPADRDTLARLVLDATAASPVNGLLRGSHPSLFSLSHNGREVAPRAVRRLDHLPERSTFDDFDRAAPGSPDLPALVHRGGTTPRAAHSVTLAGGSLAEQQSRRLHVRGICMPRGDGLLEVEQHLYNPHGSIFHFVCDDAPSTAGRRAPDATAYLSAGIGFCFMTQLGRYAQIMRKRLDRYRILQDTHFALGGASGNTGVAGAAAPVETHVYLESGEDDDFARTALDMAEQTCFLHALCRTDLKARVSIGDFADSLPLPVGH